MKWACMQKYHSNGKVSATVYQVHDDYEPVVELNQDHDLYIDIFESKEDAEQFKTETLNA